MARLKEQRKLTLGLTKKVEAKLTPIDDLDPYYAGKKVLEIIVEITEF